MVRKYHLTIISIIHEDYFVAPEEMMCTDSVTKFSEWVTATGKLFWNQKTILSWSSLTEILTPDAHEP